jgi:hypothetical protein
MLKNIFQLFTQGARTLTARKEGWHWLVPGAQPHRPAPRQRGCAKREAGQGSRFTIRIPCMLEPAPAAVTAVDPDQAPLLRH